jgi:hypothetical protein
MLFFFSVAFPLLVVSKKNFSDVSLSLSLSLYVITVKSSTYKPDSAVTKSGRSSGRCARARGGDRTRALGRVETLGASQLERGEARRLD